MHPHLFVCEPGTIAPVLDSYQRGFIYIMLEITANVVTSWQFAIDDIMRDLRFDFPFRLTATKSEHAHGSRGPLCGSVLLQLAGMLEELPPPLFSGPQGLTHPLLRMGLPPRPFSRVISR